MKLKLKKYFVLSNWIIFLLIRIRNINSIISTISMRIKGKLMDVNLGENIQFRGSCYFIRHSFGGTITIGDRCSIVSDLITSTAASLYAKTKRSAFSGNSHLDDGVGLNGTSFVA